MRWLLATGLLWTLALSAPAPSAAVEIRTTWWAEGQLRTEGTYVRDVRHGEYLSWHENGQLAEVRHYEEGREVGRQQAWTDDGVLFLNYDVRHGRRYGLVNSKPCLPAEDTSTSWALDGSADGSTDGSTGEGM